MKYVIAFGDLKPLDKIKVGGKSYSLGVMTQNGIKVPPGFAVTTNAYNELYKQRKDLGEDFSKQVLSAFDSLGASLVAVRSSAVAEDSENESWAGQLESYLNVDREHVLEAIYKC